MLNPDPSNVDWNTQLGNVLQILGIRDQDWDYLLVGDGSGSGWNLGAGWACTTIERVTGDRVLTHGAWSAGTVGLAEAMAYLQALVTLEATKGKAIRKRHKKSPVRIHIFSDSDVTVHYGRRDCPRHTNTWIWQAFDTFEENNWILTWHWMRRDSTALNTLMDKLSRDARLACEKAAFDESIDPFVYNPF